MDAYVRNSIQQGSGWLLMLSTCAPMIFIGRSTVWTGRHRKSIGVGEANRDPTTCTSLKYSYAEPEGMVHDIDSCKCLVAKQATRSPAKRKLASFDTGSAECQRGSWGVLLCFFFFQFWALVGIERSLVQCRSWLPASCQNCCTARAGCIWQIWVGPGADLIGRVSSRGSSSVQYLKNIEHTCAQVSATQFWRLQSLRLNSAPSECSCV